MDLLTIPEAARRLRLGRSTVYLMTQRGDLPCVRFGRAVRIPAHLLDKWIEHQTTGVDPRDVA